MLTSDDSSARNRARPLVLLLFLAVAGCYDGASLGGPGQDAGGAAGLSGAASEGNDTDGDSGGGEGVAEADPGLISLRRLTNTEYDNTMRDLFYGIDISPAAVFPADTVSLGFDNISSVQSLTPTLFELYERAAEQVLEAGLAADAPGRDAILSCSPALGQEASCAAEILAEFGRRAYRRPLTGDEVDGLVTVMSTALEAGSDFDEAIRVALKAVLVSPHFLFRVEIDPDPTSPALHLVNDFELATRLSYLLWSSMPDDELFAVAATGELQGKDAVAEQVERMLASPKADALVSNFAAQWLRLRVLENPLAKDAERFPEFDAGLQASMRTEAELFIRSFIEEDRDLRELLTATDTFVDARLAELYELPPVTGSGFERVSLEGVPRRGLLTQAGVMAMLAHATTTSPVRRGKWVLDRLLCSPPQPPPAGVEIPPLSTDVGGTMREQLAIHREKPECAGCHNAMDPIGLGLEHYDAIGRYRTVDAGVTVDASGQLVGGEAFEDGLGLAEVLAKDERFPDCAVRTTMTYALGREVVLGDQVEVEGILATLDAGGMSFRGLLVALATTDTFRMRRPGAE